MRGRLSRMMVQLREQGFVSFARMSIRALIGERPMKGFRPFVQYFEGKKGVEVGGPSRVFSKGSALPVYGLAATIDNCTFSNQTIWEGEVKEGLTFRFSKDKVGRQFLCDGTNLATIPDGSYDFVLASHVIEHIANPLKALHEWKRVIRDRGVLLMCAPNKEMTFDHRRPKTSLEHLREDYAKGVGEDDLTHVPEILDLHDLSMDPEAGTFEEFSERSKHNYDNRCLHHHVFTPESIAEALKCVGFDILLVTTHPPHHIVVLAQKNG